MLGATGVYVPCTKHTDCSLTASCRVQHNTYACNRLNRLPPTSQLPPLSPCISSPTHTRYACNPWGATTRSTNGRPPEVAPAVLSAVRKELRRIQAGLATGTLGPRPDSPIGAALGSVVDNYLRSW